VPSGTLFYIDFNLKKFVEVDHPKFLSCLALLCFLQEKHHQEINRHNKPTMSPSCCHDVDTFQTQILFVVISYISPEIDHDLQIVQIVGMRIKIPLAAQPLILNARLKNIQLNQAAKKGCKLE